MCDDGTNNGSYGTCMPGCGSLAPYCGDGATEPGMEDCDDSGESATCDSDCTFAICPDSTLNTTAGEICDEGGDTATCDGDCTGVLCGDTYVNTVAGEACDDGTNDGSYGTCMPGCGSLAPYCGDGIIDPPYEECDGDPDCNTDCTWDFYCSSVSPGTLSSTTDSDLTALGNGFDTDMTVTLIGQPPLNPLIDIAVLNPYWLTNTGSVSLVAASLGLNDGTYQVVLNNVADAETAICTDTVDLVATPGITVTDVEPDIAWTGTGTDSIISDMIVEVTGTGFTEVPMVTWINVSNPSIRFDAPYVIWNNSTSLTALCPTESESMPPGMYNVEVENPLPLDVGAFWIDVVVLGEFEVTSLPPPVIDEVDPFRSPASTSNLVTIEGANFAPGVVVQLLDSSDLSVLYTFTPAPGDVDPLGTWLDVTIFGVSQGVYPVKVLNPDGQFDLYYFWGSTSAAVAHLTEFVEYPTVIMDTPRWRHASVPGFDPYGGAYIYTGGGLDAAGTVLDTVEIMPVSISGELAQPWISQKWDPSTETHIDNTFNTARQGLSIVRYGNWVYALGGTQYNTTLDTTVYAALDDIEMAAILDTEKQPSITSYSVDDTVGSTVLGTWYYQVSAIGPWGESLASILRMVSNGEGTITINWSPVTGATHYNIYRNINTDGDGGETFLVDTILAASTSFVDTGIAADPTEKPLPLGAIGEWETLSTTMNSPREGLDAVKIAVPDGGGGATPFIYVVGGRVDSASYVTGPPTSEAWTLDTVERSTIGMTGDLSAFTTLTETLNNERAFFPLLTSQGQNAFVSREEVFDDSENLRLIAVTGDDFWDDFTLPIDGANKGQDVIDICTIIDVAGNISPWVTQNLSAVKLNHGDDSLLFFDALFIFNGVKSESLGAYPSAHGGTTQRLLYDETLLYPDLVAMEDILYASSSSNETPQNRAYLSVVRLNGYIFAIGGVNSGPPIAAIDRGY